jgi:hypothetical protein
MCANREHRFRCEIKVGGKEFGLYAYAHGLAEAVAQADGWCHKYYPDQTTYISCFRVGYSSDESAVEHGAILPEATELLRHKREREQSALETLVREQREHERAALDAAVDLAIG